MKQLVPVLASVQYNKLSWCAEKDLDMSLKHHQNEAEPNLPSVLRQTLTIIAAETESTISLSPAAMLSLR